MTPFDFALTEEEAGVAASRAAWRAALGQGLLARHLGPLAAFILAVTFAAILGWTGLISRRAAEIALILSAAAYMIYRLWTRRQFLNVRRAAMAWGASQRETASLSLDETGFRRGGGAWLFAEGLEVEEVAGLVYVWPKQGWPLVWPRRATEEAEDWLAFTRSRAVSRQIAQAVDDDD